MSALYLLIPLAMLFVFVAIGAFIWAARSGQWDDLETPRHRVLFDDEEACSKPESLEDRAGSAVSRTGERPLS